MDLIISAPKPSTPATRQIQIQLFVHAHTCTHPRGSVILSTSRFLQSLMAVCLSKMILNENNNISAQCQLCCPCYTGLAFIQTAGCLWWPLHWQVGLLRLRFGMGRKLNFPFKCCYINWSHLGKLYFETWTVNSPALIFGQMYLLFYNSFLTQP